MKPDQETHTTCFLLEECLVGVIDVFYFITETIVLFYNITLYFIFNLTYFLLLKPL
jgi:hypothetical protein